MSKPLEGLSPWGMRPQHSVQVGPMARGFEARVTLPGSKSFTNRALVLAGVAEGESVLRRPLFSDDSYWCTEALGGLGVAVEADREAEVIRVRGADRLRPVEGRRIFVGSAGTIARFLPGLVAARGEGEVRLEATDQLSGRPVAELITALSDLGAQIRLPAVGGSFPMTIQGGGLRGGEVRIRGDKSSQFISGLLLAAPLAERGTTIIVEGPTVQPDYLRITLQVMRAFGVEVEAAKDLSRFEVAPQAYVAPDLTLEADASTATYFTALAAVLGGTVTVGNLEVETHQPDIEFLDILATLGCEVTRGPRGVTVTGPARLVSGRTFDMTSCSDAAPALAAIAPFAEGATELRGLAHTRAHESDRIAVVAENLKAAGVAVEEHADGLTIQPAGPGLRHFQVHPHDDHRMAMAFAVFAAAGKGAEVLEPACVSKTCPQFFSRLRALGAPVEGLG